MTHWFSCPKFTVGLTIKEDTIVSAPPIVRKFIGQPLDNLINWAEKKFGKVEVVEVDAPKN